MRLSDELQLEVHGKLEGFNPGGSIKDRPAFAIVAGAVADGSAIPGRSLVVESSSGNFGLGLAQACRYFGLDLLCIVDPKTPAPTIALMRAYGARVEIVDTPDPVSGEYLPVRLARVAELLQQIPEAYWPNQYGNPKSALAHHQTAQEIVSALEGRVDYLFCATSTCGTLRGCSEFLRATQMATKTIAVDAQGSAIFGQPPKTRYIPGLGAAVQPQLYAPELADEIVHVSDLDSVTACRYLLQNESLLVGGSSGAVAAALRKIAPAIPCGAKCVLIMPDRGDRYLDTIYNDQWVAEKLGYVPNAGAPWLPYKGEIA
jgi:cysteine synthase A